MCVLVLDCLIGKQKKNMSYCIQKIFVAKLLTLTDVKLFYLLHFIYYIYKLYIYILYSFITLLHRFYLEFKVTVKN